MMLMPRRDYDLFGDDFFGDDFFKPEKNTLMKTDIKETDNSYILDKYDNGSIVKYDKTGKVVKTSSQKYSGNDINQQNVSYKSPPFIFR